MDPGKLAANGGAGLRTVSARLHRCLDVSDALHSDSVLVVAINVLVLELTDFVEQDTELVGDVRDVLVAGLAPDGELLSNLHALLGDSLQTPHDVLLHLHELRQLLSQIGTEGATRIAAERMSKVTLAKEATGLGGRGGRRGALDIKCQPNVLSGRA
jgi:hypothetical protein